MSGVGEEPCAKWPGNVQHQPAAGLRSLCLVVSQQGQWLLGAEVIKSLLICN